MYEEKCIHVFMLFIASIVPQQTFSTLFHIAGMFSDPQTITQVGSSPVSVIETNGTHSQCF